jgi:peptide deformylase
MLEILQDGHPILRVVAKPIESNLYLEDLVDSMKETMDKADGVGLAAPQVGHSIRLFLVLDVESMGIKTFINPEILELSEETCDFEEGCLSIKGVTGVVNRPERVKVKYQDLDMTEHTEEFDGYVARIILHEYDHLEGKLFTDYLV